MKKPLERRASGYACLDSAVPEEIRSFAFQAWAWGDRDGAEKPGGWNLRPVHRPRFRDY